MNKLVKDLSKYSLTELKVLSQEYGGHKTIHEIALLIHKKAEMNGYSTTQYSEIVNHLNDETGNNSMLNKVLVIEEKAYSHKQKIIHLRLKPQQTDIYNNVQITTAQDTPAEEFYDDFDKLHDTFPSRYTYFLIYAKKDVQDRVLSSHVMLVITEINHQTKQYNIYKYNSGYRDKDAEIKMDKHIIEFYNKYYKKPDYYYNIIQTDSWCPMSLQGSTNICGVYCFHIYHLLNKYTDISITDIIRESVREKVMPFLQELASKIPGTSSTQMRLA